MQKVKRVNDAFSLLELLTVIAIASILLALSVPQYKQYVVRGKMLEVVEVLKSYLESVQRQYLADGSGNIPGTAKDLVSGAGFTAVSVSPYIDALSYTNGSSWANRGAMVQAIVSSELGNGIKDFVAGEEGAYNRVAIAFYMDGDLFRIMCGAWTNDATEIPQEYLPSGCNDLDFGAVVTGN